MKLLLVGGAGRVGTMTAPYLKSKHRLRVLDVVPPHDPEIEYIQGSVTDPEAIQRALKGMDTFIYMAMKNPTSEISSAATFEDILMNHKRNIMGVHSLLHRPKPDGIHRGVYPRTFTTSAEPRVGEDGSPRWSPKP